MGNIYFNGDRFIVVGTGYNEADQFGIWARPDWADEDEFHIYFFTEKLLRTDNVSAFDPSTIAYGQIWHRTLYNGKILTIKIQGKVKDDIWYCRIMNGDFAGADKKYSETTIRGGFWKDGTNGL